MDLSNSTAYPTDPEGLDGLISIDGSLNELLDRISVLPDSTFLTEAVKEEDSFNFSFPPLKSNAGIGKWDLDRPTVVSTD